MIILSYNSRGLGRGIKWAAVRRLIVKHKVNLVCIQETKREKFNKSICQAIWGDSTAHWDYVPSVQAAGGLLCLWNNSILLRSVPNSKLSSNPFISIEFVKFC